MTENAEQQRKTRALPRIFGDFTEVMKAEANGELHGRLFQIQCDSETSYVAKTLDHECFVTAASESAALSAFLKTMPVKAVKMRKEDCEARKLAVLSEWKESMQIKEEE